MAADRETAPDLAPLRARIADPQAAPVRLLMVCMGNICRSPTADGVMRAMVRRANLQSRIVVDSAGTIDDHAGAPPDARARDHAQRRGYDIGGLRARWLSAQDFADFDLVLVMDAQNLRAARARCPDDARLARITRLSAFAPGPDRGVDVPDPYYGGDAGFERVLDLVEASCAGLLRALAPG